MPGDNSSQDTTEIVIKNQKYSFINGKLYVIEPYNKEVTEIRDVELFYRLLLAANQNHQIGIIKTVLEKITFKENVCGLLSSFVLENDVNTDVLLTIFNFMNMHMEYFNLTSQFIICAAAKTKDITHFYNNAILHENLELALDLLISTNSLKVNVELFMKSFNALPRDKKYKFLINTKHLNKIYELCKTNPEKYKFIVKYYERFNHMNQDIKKTKNQTNKNNMIEFIESLDFDAENSWFANATKIIKDDFKDGYKTSKKRVEIEYDDISEVIFYAGFTDSTLETYVKDIPESNDLVTFNPHEDIESQVLIGLAIDDDNTLEQALNSDINILKIEEYQAGDQYLYDIGGYSVSEHELIAILDKYEQDIFIQVEATELPASGFTYMSDNIQIQSTSTPIQLCQDGEKLSSGINFFDGEQYLLQSTTSRKIEIIHEELIERFGKIPTKEELIYIAKNDPAALPSDLTYQKAKIDEPEYSILGSIFLATGIYTVYHLYKDVFSFHKHYPQLIANEIDQMSNRDLYEIYKSNNGKSQSEEALKVAISLDSHKKTIARTKNKVNRILFGALLMVATITMPIFPVVPFLIIVAITAVVLGFIGRRLYNKIDEIDKLNLKKYFNEHSQNNLENFNRIKKSLFNATNRKISIPKTRSKLYNTFNRLSKYPMMPDLIKIASVFKSLNPFLALATIFVQGVKNMYLGARDLYSAIRDTSKRANSLDIKVFEIKSNTDDINRRLTVLQAKSRLAEYLKNNPVRHDQKYLDYIKNKQGYWFKLKSFMRQIISKSGLIEDNDIYLQKKYIFSNLNGYRQLNAFDDLKQATNNWYTIRKIKALLEKDLKENPVSIEAIKEFNFDDPNALYQLSNSSNSEVKSRTQNAIYKYVVKENSKSIAAKLFKPIVTLLAAATVVGFGIALAFTGITIPLALGSALVFMAGTASAYAYCRYKQFKVEKAHLNNIKTKRDYITKQIIDNIKPTNDQEDKITFRPDCKSGTINSTAPDSNPKYYINPPKEPQHPSNSRK